MLKPFKFKPDEADIKQTYAAISQLGSLYLPAYKSFRRDVWPKLLVNRPSDREIRDIETDGYQTWIEISNRLHKPQEKDDSSIATPLFAFNYDENPHIFVADDMIIETIGILSNPQSIDCDKMLLQLTDEVSTDGVYRRQMRILTINHICGNCSPAGDIKLKAYLIEYRTATNDKYAVNGIEGLPSCQMNPGQNLVFLEIPRFS